MHIRDPLLHSLCPIKWPNVLYSAFTGPLVTHEFRRHVALSGKTLGSRGPLLHRIEVKTSWSSHPNQYPTSTQSNEGQRTANQAFSDRKLIIYKNCDRIPLSRERNMSEYIYIANPEKEKSFAGKQHIVTKCVSLGRHKEPYCASDYLPLYYSGTCFLFWS